MTKDIKVIFFCNANSSKEKINIRLIFYSFDCDIRHLKSIVKKRIRYHVRNMKARSRKGRFRVQ